MAAKPWLTTQGLINAVKRKISLPIEQATFSLADVISFLNEEMQISQVPSIMEFSEEYFVYKVRTPLVANVTHYDIPDRAIGMKVRDIFIEDENGNMGETARISPDDKAYWQSNAVNYTQNYMYYVEGNQIVFAPNSQTSTGYIVFYIYLRPNQLVMDDRAAIAQNFVKKITFGVNPSPGDTITINGVVYTAVASGAGLHEFNVGVSATATAANFAASLVAPLSATSSGTTAQVSYSVGTYEFSSSNNDIEVSSETGINFDQLPSEWTDPDTLQTETLFEEGGVIDFLQTKPGHRIYEYDQTIISIEGTTAFFSSIPEKFIVGDYICLANECIIPQIPPDLHNGLAERAGARILASIGDQQGLQVSMAKINEIDGRQGTLLNNRVTGGPMKISGRHSMLRNGKKWFRRIF